MIGKLFLIKSMLNLYEINCEQNETYDFWDSDVLETWYLVLESFIFSFSVGERPLPSHQPATTQKFAKRRGADRRGGGLVLECEYVLTLYPYINGHNIVSEIREVIASMDGGDTVQLAAQDNQ